MAKRFSIFILFIVSVSISIVAEPIDSLYKKIMSESRISYVDANELMLRLDALGVTDSLYSYDNNTPDNVMRIDVAQSISDYYLAQSKFSQSIKAGKRALDFARQEKDSAAIATALSTLGVCYVRQGQYDNASDVMREELRIDSLIKDYANMSTVYNNMAGLFVSAGRIPEAKTCVLKAIKLEKSLDDPSHLSVRYGMAAEIYNKLGDTETALDYAKKAYELDRNSGDPIKTARRLSQMADIRSSVGDYDEAEVLYMKSVDLLEKAGEKMSWTINMKQLGRLLIKQQRYNDAIKYLKLGEEKARELGNVFILQQICESLSLAYKNVDCSKAYEYLSESAALKDSINSDRLQQQISDSQAEHDAEEYAATIADQAQTIHKQQLVLASLGAVVIALALLCYRTARKNKETVVSGNDASPAIGIESANMPSDETGSNTSEVESPDDLEISSDSEVGRAEKPDGTELKSYEIEFLGKVDDFISQNISKSEFTADILASEMAMSRSQLDRRLKALRGKGASACIQDSRMERAHSLIMETDKTIMEVAYSCGFEDTSYFARVFRQYYNTSPSQLRKETT